MKVTCPQCQAAIEVDAFFLPIEQELELECPRCHKIAIFKVPDISRVSEQSNVREQSKNQKDQEESQPQPKKTSKKRGLEVPNHPIVFWIVVIILALLVGGGAFLYSKRFAIPTQPVQTIVSPASPTQVLPSDLAKSLKAKGQDVEIKAEKEAKPKATAEEASTQIALSPALSLLPLETRERFETFLPTTLESLRGEIAEFVRMNEKNPGEALRMLAEIHAYLGMRKGNKAWISYGYETAFRYQKSYPKDPFSNRAMAMALVGARQFKQAISFAQKIAKFKPQDPLGLTLLGIALNQEGTTQEGMKVLLEASQKHPSSFFATEALALACVKNREFGKAEPFVRRLLVQDPKDIYSLRLLGDVLEGQEKWNDLVDVYEPLVKEFPSDWRMVFTLARAYRLAGRFSESRGQLDSLLNSRNLSWTRQEEALVQLERGKVELEQERFQESLTYFQKAAQADPSNLGVLQFLGGSYFRLKNYRLAVQTYQKALSLSPDNLKTVRYLAMSLVEGEQYEAAERHLMSLIQSPEEDASLYYHLSRAREGLGDKEKATEYLRKALALSPDYENAKARLEKLLTR